MDKSEARAKMDKILNATSAVFELPTDVIIGNSRKRVPVEARCVFTHLAVEANVPKPWVSEYLNKERTAYIYYLKLYDAMIRELYSFAFRTSNLAKL